MNAELWQSVILGIVQGLTEFLPVSSSGHLHLVREFFFPGGLNTEDNLLFTVTVHGGTALATVVIFYKDILHIFKGLFQGKRDERQFAWAIVVSMRPAAFIGYYFNDLIKNFFEAGAGTTFLVAAMLVLTGLLLMLASRAKQTHKKVSTADAVIIGIAQAIAILPGISRSGATISTSVLLGIDRERAARFSFLMVVPLILGKMALDSKELYENPSAIDGQNLLPLLVGFAAAFLTGLWACKAMIAWVKKSKLSYFAIYCFAVGALATIGMVVRS